MLLPYCSFKRMSNGREPKLQAKSEFLYAWTGPRGRRNEWDGGREHLEMPKEKVVDSIKRKNTPYM